MAYINCLKDFELVNPNYIIVYDSVFSYQGWRYGPPDPPAGTETRIFIETQGFKTREEVIEWIKINSTSEYSSIKTFKVFMVDALSIKTEITITLA